MDKIITSEDFTKIQEKNLEYLKRDEELPFRLTFRDNLTYRDKKIKKKKFFTIKNNEFISW